MRCAICGRVFDVKTRCNNCYKAKCLECEHKEIPIIKRLRICRECDVHKKCLDCHFYICSPECQKKFNEKVEELFRERHADLIGKSLIIDPAVGDEYEIARISAKMRIKDELSRPVRIENLKENLKRHGLEEWLPYAEHLMILNERQCGSTTVDVMLDRLYTVYYSGEIEPTRGYGYYWTRADDGWQEITPEGLGDFIPDDKMRFPEYGDVEGAPALSVVEHTDAT